MIQWPRQTGQAGGVLSERAVWASSPRSRHTDEWDDALCWYVAGSP